MARRKCSVALALAFASGAGGSLQMSCASFLGSGHRIEFYGDDGTLVLANPTRDYFRGFAADAGPAARNSLAGRLRYDIAPTTLPPISRIAPVRGWCGALSTPARRAAAASPGFAEGYRVQYLIDAASAPMKPAAGSTRLAEEEATERVGAFWLPAAAASSARRWSRRWCARRGRARLRRQFARLAAPPARGRARHRVRATATSAMPPRSMRAMRGIDEVHHLAFVNGTATFYSAPDLVLDVGVKGIVNVIDACRAQGVGRWSWRRARRSTSRRRACRLTRRAPLVVPDPLNPRLSYGAGKIISEMMAINHGRKHFERVLIFRPHNVYGPDMGFDHVIPQFAMRLKQAQQRMHGACRFPIQGSGSETRSFCHVDDLVAGVMVMRDQAASISASITSAPRRRSPSPISPAAWRAIAGREIVLGPSAGAAGSTPRRCPDISKLAALGYAPARLARRRACRRRSDWYWAHEGLAPKVRSVTSR